MATTGSVVFSVKSDFTTIELLLVLIQQQARAIAATAAKMREAKQYGVTSCL